MILRGWPGRALWLALALCPVWAWAAAPLYGSAETTQLVDADATRAGVLAAFGRLSHRVRPRDTFLFYVASHSVIDEATDSFLLIPQDLSDLSSWQTMAGQAIDANTLVAALSRIEARDALLFLDTCHAGKVSADNLANVGHESGRYLLAASSSGQDAEGNVGALTLGEYVSRRVGQLAVEKHHAQNAIFCTAQQDLRSFSIGHVTR